MKKVFALIAFTATVILSPVLNAQVIKIGSIAPARSPWDKALRELSKEWASITNGKVRIKVYSGGIAGNESDMIRKMRVGILGGAGFTNRGLTKLHPEVYVLNIPFLFQSEEELQYVADKLKPGFEKEIEKKGYKVIIWTSAGWIHFFSKNAVFSPEDLKKHRISFSTDEPKMEQAWKSAGFRIIPNDLKDLMMALQSGMVNAFYLPPLLAGSGQYFAMAPNMCSQKVAPLFGGIVITRKMWNRVPAEYHEKLLQSAQKLSERLQKETITLEKNIMSKMTEKGLKINKASDADAREWQKTAAKGLSHLIGQAFSREIYETLIKNLEEFRKKNG